MLLLQRDHCNVTMGSFARISPSPRDSGERAGVRGCGD